VKRLRFTRCCGDAPPDGPSKVGPSGGLPGRITKTFEGTPNAGSERDERALSTWRIRLAGFALLAAAVWYAPWLVAHADVGVGWVGIPFVAANLLVVASMLVTFVNNWRRSVPPVRLVLRGREPVVAVVIPTCGEPPSMVARTARSVLRQDWPRERLVVVVSDDARSPAIADVTRSLALKNPGATVVYHQPPRRGSPERRGDAKAGNLNSAVERLDRECGRIDFVETRDADDEVGDPSFLRQCVGQLLADENLAFVQTIKEVRVSAGDPFNNNELDFYRGSMYAKNAANAVFSCGSGVVWRRFALDDIGGFPTWNLVEDLQSGVEALRRGWRALYLPIVGALAQYAPEDIPVVYKQRGTWALDTVRLVVWGGLRGLTFRQRLHFLEMALFYLQSFALLGFVLASAVWFTAGVYPLASDQLSHAEHFLPFGVAVELFVVTLFTGHPLTAVWRGRQIRFGLMTVFMKASLKAIFGGPRRKPTYRVTRKFDQHRWYWRETAAQAALLAALVAGVVFSLATRPVAVYDVVSAYWTALFIVFLGGFVRRSWFGISWAAGLVRALRARVPRASPRIRYAFAVATAVALSTMTAAGLNAGV